MNNMKKPSIRFKGFTEDWEQRKAKNLFISTADKGYPELPVLSATQDRGMIRRDENGINIYHNKKNEEGYKRVLPGQFVIHLRSFQGGFAHSAIEGITSPAYTVFGFLESEKHNSNYWKHVFNSKEFIRRLEIVTYGIRDGRSISYDEFLTMDFVYPTQEEQSEISNYLETLDHLITLHQRKYDKLVNVKKSMLEKMFPREGKNIPEIRFSGFTETWEQRKLNEICNYTSSSLTVNNVSEKGRYSLYDANTQIGMIDLFHMSEDYITVIKDGAGVGRIRKLPKNTAFIGTMGALTSNNNELDFLYYLLEKKDLSKQFTGSTIPHIYFKDYGEDSVLVPNFDEQHQLGIYFSNLDNLITLHQREVEKLKNIKKSCLEKMFV